MNDYRHKNYTEKSTKRQTLVWCEFLVYLETEHMSGTNGDGKRRTQCYALAQAEDIG